MATIPADAKRGFLLVIGAIAALWLASVIQNHLGG